MDCTMGSKARESFVQVVVGYAQTMAERMYEEIKEANPELKRMEKGVLTELHGFLRARFKRRRWAETITLRPAPSRCYSRLALY